MRFVPAEIAKQMSAENNLKPREYFRQYVTISSHANFSFKLIGSMTRSMTSEFVVTRLTLVPDLNSHNPSVH